MIRSIILCCVAALTLSLPPILRGSEDPPVIRLASVPTESAISLRRDLEPLRQALEATLERKVELFFASDYTGVIETMRFKRVDIGLFGNQSGIDAVDRANGEIFAQVLDPDGNPGYWSVLVVRNDSPIDTLAALLDRRDTLALGLGDPQSTSGYLVPGYYAFARNQIDPVREFKAVRNATHEANLLAVVNGHLDACAASNEALFRLERAQPALAKRLKVIWKSPLIASDPLVFRADLTPELKKRIREFFYAYGKTAEEKQSLAVMKWSGFRPSTNAQLVPFRVLRLELERRRLAADTSLSENHRVRLQAEIERRLSELATSSTP